MASVLKRGLEREGYAVDVAATGEDALWAGREFPYDAVVLDAMIPVPDGFDVCRRLREAGRWMPVMMLTARDSVDDRVRGLDAGADDYLPKPFSFAELFARLRALVAPGPRGAAGGARGRRPSPRPGDQGREPGTDGRSRCRHVSSRCSSCCCATRVRCSAARAILDHVWDFAYDGTSNVVDVYVRYVRDKVDRPFDRRAIETVRAPAIDSAATAAEAATAAASIRPAPCRVGTPTRRARSAPTVHRAMTIQAVAGHPLPVTADLPAWTSQYDGSSLGELACRKPSPSDRTPRPADQGEQRVRPPIAGPIESTVSRWPTQDAEHGEGDQPDQDEAGHRQPVRRPPAARPARLPGDVQQRDRHRRHQ